MKFTNSQNEFRHPFHIVMDFEATLQVVKDQDQSANTIKTHKHIANSVGLKYNCIHDEHSESRVIFNDPNQESLLKKMILEIERLTIKSYELTQQNRDPTVLIIFFWKFFGRNIFKICRIIFSFQSVLFELISCAIQSIYCN